MRKQEEIPDDVRRAAKRAGKSVSDYLRDLRASVATRPLSFRPSEEVREEIARIAAKAKVKPATVVRELVEEAIAARRKAA